MTQNDEEAKKQIFLVKIILIVISTVLFIKTFDFRLVFDLIDVFWNQSAENKCWQKFKEERCSIENPNYECRRLLECTAESKKDGLWNFDNFMAFVLVAAILILVFSFRYLKKMERIGRGIRRKF